MVPPHLFMNFRVVDEHGRQLGMGRNLGALKAELGAQARGAFQALAGLKVRGSPRRRPLGERGLRRTPARKRRPAPPAGRPPAAQRPSSATPPGPSASCPS